jgi:hypothetical protein
MTVGELDADGARQLAHNPQSFCEDAIMSCSVVLDWIAAHRAYATLPDGTSEITRPQVLPFYIIAPEVGLHAFDLSGLRTKGPRVVDVDAELLWKPSVHSELAPSFGRWFDGFVHAGCEAFGVRGALAQMARREAAEHAAREQEKARAAALAARALVAGRPEKFDIMLPLMVRRSTAGIIVLTLFMVVAVGFLVTMGRWDPGMAIRAVIALGLLVYCVKRVLASRHVIEIDDQGILDSATRKTRIPWVAIADITCETSRNGGTLIVSLKGPAPETVRIDLDGVRTPIQTIVSSAIAYLEAARKAGRREVASGDN